MLTGTFSRPWTLDVRALEVRLDPFRGVDVCLSQPRFEHVVDESVATTADGHYDVWMYLVL